MRMIWIISLNLLVPELTSRPYGSALTLSYQHNGGTSSVRSGRVFLLCATSDVFLTLGQQFPGVSGLLAPATLVYELPR